MRWAAALLAVVLLAGCVGTDLTPPLASAAETVVADPAGLRRQHGIPDCPVDTASQSSGPSAAVMGGLPDLTLRCLGGDSPVRLASLRGPMLVNLWAVWCTPCRVEGPHLASFAKAASGRVTLVGVDTADPDPALAAEFAQSVGWTYMQVQDPGHRLPDALGLKGLPLTLFVDASGRVVYRQVGAFESEQQIRDLVASHLGVRL